jgi:hypothetical protein
MPSIELSPLTLPKVADIFFKRLNKMNITPKQLLDIVSLSIEAVNSKADPTIVSHNESFFTNGTSTALVTAVENEVNTILGDEHDLETKVEIVKIAKALNEHIAAIRLGMRLNRQSEEE